MGKIKMNDKVDILVATYNGEKYLKEQLDSILNQTYNNIRIIISDDNSTDGTRDILKQYEANNKITVFYQENNLGYIKNFEFLLKKVENDIYMLSDQDDVWMPEKIEKTYETFEKEKAGQGLRLLPHRGIPDLRAEGPVVPLQGTT